MLQACRFGLRAPPLSLAGLPLPLSPVPTLCGLELRRTLRTVGAALETFDVVGSVRIVLLAPSLDDQLICLAATERARQRLGGILDRITVHAGEVVGVDGTHGRALGSCGQCRPRAWAGHRCAIRR